MIIKRILIKINAIIALLEELINFSLNTLVKRKIYTNETTLLLIKVFVNNSSNSNSSNYSNSKNNNENIIPQDVYKNKDSFINTNNTKNNSNQINSINIPKDTSQISNNSNSYSNNIPLIILPVINLENWCFSNINKKDKLLSKIFNYGKNGNYSKIN
ncbi:hypothetical protein H8356DRAFT_1323004 [Neocallimastix lanati (nom. inval.)]|nr:hypothetical protein H8356DRAFT_1323004 [Neocallimastix sp. JGI-2020a]